MTAVDIPRFAVVGHPNKGKSSIVATLAEDDAVGISDTPGTTTRALHFPLAVDGDTLYELVDTPGFQRARQTLAWLEQWLVDNAAGADQRAEAVAAFVAQHDGGGRFADECELLKPLLAGAGILYVVDGSRPYGREYEAEMDILRWTGCPRLALINLIGDGDYVAEWQRALDQYFSVVRVFDAMAADFGKRIDLLSAFGHLRDDWRPSLTRAIEVLEAERDRRLRRSAESIAAQLIDSLTLTVARGLPSKSAAETASDALKDELEQVLVEKLRKRETSSRVAVQEIYQHRQLAAPSASPAALDEDLFSEQSWQVFGLSKSQLVVTAAAGGALVGGGVDLLLGGASLMLGAGIGAMVGGASAFFGGETLTEARVLGLRVGGYELQVGPVKDRNFPWVMLGRAWLHHRHVSERNHARRDALVLDATAEAHLTDDIDLAVRRRFESVFASIRSDGAANSEQRASLTELVIELLRDAGEKRRAESDDTAA